MELLEHRRYRGKEYTISTLSIDGKVFCDVLSDPDRGLSSSMMNSEISSRKIFGKTAIPTGRYKVTMGVVSPKFKERSWAKRWGGKLPRVEGVPGFVGILIHVGNRPEDTDGCLLVGENKVKGQVINSTATFDRLMPILIEAWYRGEEIWLTVE